MQWFFTGGQITSKEVIGHILLLLLRILIESNFLLFQVGKAKAQENGSKAQGHRVINGRLGLE